MEVYLIDGTYELFRHYFAVPGATDSKGHEIGAVRGVIGSVISLLEKGATHVGVATDHVIESFRNELYPYYKTGEGIPADLLVQFPLLEELLKLLGVTVWPMVEFEADDALASAAIKAAQDERVSKVLICTPDKDLAQCVVGERIVLFDRRREIVYDESGVVSKFGVSPESIPDYLAVVGDSADGYPGLPGWGAKAAAAVLSQYRHFENVPKDPLLWPKSVRGAAKLAATLFGSWEDALLFRRLARLRVDAPVFNDIEELRWRGPAPQFESACARLNAEKLYRRARALAAGAGLRD